MKALLINYNYTPTWLLTSNLDYLIYDRSDSDEYLKDFPKERIVKTTNTGQVDYDKLSFLVDFYDVLPEYFLWGKTNLFKYVDEETFAQALKNLAFTPLLRQDHKTYSDRLGKVCFYDQGMYHERNDSWYLTQQPAKYFESWSEWAQMFMLPSPQYIPFPPGGNFILTRERVHRYSRDFYDKMRQLMPYTIEPGEAQLAERSYYLLWR